MGKHLESLTDRELDERYSLARGWIKVPNEFSSSQDWPYLYLSPKDGREYVSVPAYSVKQGREKVIAAIRKKEEIRSDGLREGIDAALETEKGNEDATTGR